MNIIQDFIPVSNANRPGTHITPQFITIHNTDNDTAGAGAAAHNRYVRGADTIHRKVSWHFTVDDHGAYQHLPTSEMGWHASTHSGNTKSVGIEICMNRDMNTTVGYANAARLVAHCVQSLGLNFPSCMKQHHDWSGKNCPRVIRTGAVINWDNFIELCADQVSNKSEISLSEPSLDKSGDAAWSNPAESAILDSIDQHFKAHGGVDEDE